MMTEKLKAALRFAQSLTEEERKVLIDELTKKKLWGEFSEETKRYLGPSNATGVCPSCQRSL